MIKIYAKDLEDGSKAVGLFNTSVGTNTASGITVQWSGSQTDEGQTPWCAICGGRKTLANLQTSLRPKWRRTESSLCALTTEANE